MTVEFRGYIVLTELEPLEIYPIKNFNDGNTMKLVTSLNEGGWLNIRGIGLIEIDSIEVLRSFEGMSREVRSVYIHSVPVLLENHS